MRISLGAWLAIGLAGLQFIAVLAVVFSSFLTSQRALLNHASNMLNDIGDNTILHSRHFLEPARGAAELAAALAQNNVIPNDNATKLEQLLFEQLQSAPQFAGIYYGTESGDFVYVMRSSGPGPFRTKIIRNIGTGRSTELIWRDPDFTILESRFDPEDIYDPRKRPWYIDAKDAKATIWSDPYIFFSSRQPGITLATPVEGPNGTINGIFGVDIEIGELSGFLGDLRIGVSGKAMIIHSNGNVIAHPDPDLLRAENADGKPSFVHIEDFDDPIARAAFGHLAKEGQIRVDAETLSLFTHEGRTYVSVVMPPIDESLPWITAAYAPEYDFTASIRQNRQTNLWIAAFVAITTGVFGLILANFIYKPVRAFAVRSALVSQGELDPSEPLPKTYQELEKANDTLMQEIAARRATEIEYGQTFELSSRGMAQIDVETEKLIRVNETFCTITGQTAETLAEMTLSDLTYPGDAPFNLSESGRSNTPHEINQELRILRPDGAAVWVAVNAIMVFNFDGKPLHYVLTIDDITQDKQADDQIAELSRELSNLSRDKPMGQVAAGLAHELNQPLTAITQNADSALFSIDQLSGDHPDLHATLEEIAQQSMRAGDIIKALRAFIRRDEGTKNDFDLTDLVDQTQRLVIAEARAAKVSIASNLGDLPLVHGNRLQIAQVLVNLIRNAIEALGDSDIDPREITVTATRDGEKINVMVADNGPGVDPSINLFSEFESTKPQGMGLGLSICKSIIQANNERLWHERRRPRGAEFHFTISVANPSEPGTT